MTSYDLGKIAYEAYCETTDWKSAVTGAPLPHFDQQSALIQAAWRAAGRAVRRTVMEDLITIGDTQEPGIISELKKEGLGDGLGMFDEPNDTTSE